MYCTNCGKEMPEGTVFCTQCGARMVDASAPPRSVPETQRPTTAALLSLLLPGLGHCYLSDYRNGGLLAVSYLVVIATTLWAAYGAGFTSSAVIAAVLILCAACWCAIWVLAIVTSYDRAKALAAAAPHV